MKKILLFYPSWNIDSVPTVWALIESLIRSEYFIEICLLNSQSHKRPIFSKKNLNLYYRKERIFNPDNFILLLAKLLKIKNVIEIYDAKIVNRMLFRIFTFIIWEVNTIIFRNVTLIFDLMRIIIIKHTKGYHAFIGVDPPGLIDAGRYSKLLNLPLIYFNLELFLSYELNDPSHKQIKEMEIELSQYSKYIIIQDEDRGKLLAADNNISIEKMLFLPNSPIGNSRRVKSQYWYKRYNINKDNKIVLCSGTIYKWAGIDKILTSLNNWPKNWVLIFHSRGDNDEDLLSLILEQNAHGQIFLSSIPVPRDEYNELVDSADIGIAFYILSTESHPWLQINLQSIGLSSGKISYYLKAGLPIIVNKETSVHKIVTDESCGIAVDSAEQIPIAIQKIEDNYSFYSENAIKTYEKYLNPDKYLKIIVQKISEL